MVDTMSGIPERGCCEELGGGREGSKEDTGGTSKGEEFEAVPEPEVARGGTWAV